MEWVLLGVAGIGGLAWAGTRIRDRLGARREQSEVLAQVVRMCGEDITLLGEQLRRLDAEAGERPLDEAARVDYQKALDGYESADRLVRRLESPEDLGPVTDTLNDARYALACVRASMAGEARPEKRTPCFFNPQHGPSVTDVMFTARAGGTKRVPACAQDAARLKAGERPEVRKVEVNGRRIDYFEARQIGRVYGDPAAASLMSSPGFSGVDSDFGAGGM